MFHACSKDLFDMKKCFSLERFILSLNVPRSVRDLFLNRKTHFTLEKFHLESTKFHFN